MTDSKSPLHWLVSGVGRSGTTALYDALQTISRQHSENFQFTHEPYLWGQATWGTQWKATAGKFSSTNSMNALGMAAHLSTPLFLQHSSSGKYPLHDQFIDQMFGHENDSLVKIIRGCGRLNSFCKRVPTLKIVHLTRNPLDTINSVLGRFSFFGDEFHPSDKSRFFEEISRDPDVEITSMSEAQLALNWWSEMNRAAYECAKSFPDQVFVLPHEAYKTSPSIVIPQVVSFLGGDPKLVAKKNFGRPLGPVTSELNLKSKDVECLEASNAQYFEDMTRHSSIAVPFNVAAYASIVSKKYCTATRGEFKPGIGRDVSPLRIRSMLTQEQQNLARETDNHLKQKQFLEGQVGDARQVLKHLTQQSAKNLETIAGKLDALTGSKHFGRAAFLSKRLRTRASAAGRSIQVLRTEPEITCIVTCRTGTTKLRRAVTSVLGQSLAPLEIIIVDKSLHGVASDLAKAVSAEFNLKSLIAREQDMGPGRLMNLAIHSSASMFITTLDGDDEYGLFKLTAEWGTIAGKLDRIAYSGICDTMQSDKAPDTQLQDFMSLSNKHRIAAISSQSAGTPRNMLFSKDAYVNSGGYDAAIDVYADWSLNMRLARQLGDWKYVDVAGTVRSGDTHAPSLSKPGQVFWSLFALWRNADWIIEHQSPTQLSTAVNCALEFHDSVEFKSRFRSALANFQTRGSIRWLLLRFGSILDKRTWLDADTRSIETALDDLLKMAEKRAATKAATR